MTWRALSISPYKQVVLNLLSNAIKFTPAFMEGGEVEVRTEWKPLRETETHHGRV
jgi:signal transduction histidine kinase